MWPVFYRPPHIIHPHATSASRRFWPFTIHYRLALAQICFSLELYLITDPRLPSVMGSAASPFHHSSRASWRLGGWFYFRGGEDGVGWGWTVHCGPCNFPPPPAVTPDRHSCRTFPGNAPDVVFVSSGLRRFEERRKAVTHASPPVEPVTET